VTTPLPRSDRVERSFNGIRDLRLVGRQVRYEQLSFWLNPLGALFTVGFSVVFLLLLGATAGSSKAGVPGYREIKLIQYYVPGFVAYGVMAASFTLLAGSLVNRREMGLLKRLRLSPLPTWALLGAIFVSTTIIVIVQIVVLLAVGIGFGVHLPQAWGPFLLALSVGLASFTALGMGASTLIPNQDAAGPVVRIVFFVLLFLSGLWFPLKSGSTLARISAWFPVRHMLTAVFAPFNLQGGASPWAWHDLIVMAVWGIIGGVIAVRRWQWSPRRSSG
jgi:ABC-2 type transport system permease protein